MLEAETEPKGLEVRPKASVQAQNTGCPHQDILHSGLIMKSQFY